MMNKVGATPDGISNQAFHPTQSSAELGNGEGGGGGIIYPAELITVSSKVQLEDATNNTESVGSYDPYQNRVIKRPTTNFDTLVHLVKGSLGTGILAMPKAFENAGYIPGFFGTIIIGFIVTYCVHVLVNCSYVVCSRRRVPTLTYAETAKEAMKDGSAFHKALTPFAEHIVNVFMIIYQMGTCSVYIVFISSSFKTIGDYYMKLNEAEDMIALRLYMCMLLVPLLLIVMVRSLRMLSPFSTFANLITIASFGITLYYIFYGGLPPLNERDPFGPPAGYALFFGTVLFALEAIGVIMPLANNMKTPKSFGGVIGVLNIAMSFIIALYVLMGLFGYLKYGDEVLGSITLNLPIEEVPAQVVQILLGVAIFISYALQNYVTIDILWGIYLKPRFLKLQYKIFVELGVRVGVVLVTFFFAVAIPNLDLFISLVGAFCLSALGVIFPAFIEMAVFEDKRQGLHLVKNICLIIFGIAGLITGTAISIRDIVHEFSD